MAKLEFCWIVRPISNSSGGVMFPNLQAPLSNCDVLRMKIQFRSLGSALMLILIAMAAICPCQADTHIFAGAQSTNQGAKLSFSNGFVFDANLTNTYLPQIL